MDNPGIDGGVVQAPTKRLKSVTAEEAEPPLYRSELGRAESGEVADSTVTVFFLHRVPALFLPCSSSSEPP